ncbi:MAG: hypothetical protein M3R38_02260 [Actinomycetota bacterium]|nr:hypothetical protein [Actinomycetota bacterium]MDP9485205.1 hypothetical protein [Actinomycetota bacterium]
MTNEVVELASAALGLISAFLEVGTAVLMARGLAARRFREERPGPTPEIEPIAREEASPFRRFARWTPRAGSRRYGRRSD